MISYLFIYSSGKIKRNEEKITFNLIKIESFKSTSDLIVTVNYSKKKLLINYKSLYFIIYL